MSWIKNTTFIKNIANQISKEVVPLIQVAAGGKGDKGDPGLTGLQGPKGDRGDQGLRGEPGQQGERGLQGAAGQNGNDGEDGAKGDTGNTGLQGFAGPTGVKGDKGDTGAQGTTGVQGAQGNPGVNPYGYALLSNDTLAQALATNYTTKLTVTANRTLTTTVPAAGIRCAVIILTSGTSSYTITFGSGFKPTGTLATGTSSGKVFVINWISDGTNLYEAGRTAAMTA